MPRTLARDEVLERRISARLGLADSPTDTYRPVEHHAGYGVGNFYPGSVLLVGEQSAKPEVNVDQQPFCDTRGCSGWLNSRLEEWKVPEERLFWVNALHNDGSEIEAGSLVRLLKPSATIALGKVAGRVLSKHGVGFTEVPHPQYWKRFHSKLPYPLKKALEQVPPRQVHLDADDDEYKVYINGELAKSAGTLVRLLRIRDAAKRHRLANFNPMPLRRWLALDLGLTEREVEAVTAFNPSLLTLTLFGKVCW